MGHLRIFVALRHETPDELTIVLVVALTHRLVGQIFE